MNRLYFGIDPGLDGAVALITDMHNAPILFDMPTLTIEGTRTIMTRSGTRKKKAHRLLNIPMIVGHFKSRLMDFMGDNGRAIVTLEKVVAMPRQNSQGQDVKMGAVSMINYGINYGILLGILTTLAIPFTEVHPASWKAKLLRDMPKGKGSSILRAKQLYPSADITLKKHEARAEALLIAHYGMMLEKGGFA